MTRLTRRGGGRVGGQSVRRRASPQPALNLGQFRLVHAVECEHLSYARVCGRTLDQRRKIDRKSTRLNSSHRCISYAVFCLKKIRIRFVCMILLASCRVILVIYRNTGNKIGLSRMLSYILMLSYFMDFTFFIFAYWDQQMLPLSPCRKFLE